VQVPTSAQVQDVSAELARRAALPRHVKAVLEALPVETHPMTQFITAITALQVRNDSVFIGRVGRGWGRNRLGEDKFITAITALQVRAHSSCAQEQLVGDNHCLCRVLAL
jgi:citrate synthase